VQTVPESLLVGSYCDPPVSAAATSVQCYASWAPGSLADYRVEVRPFRRDGHAATASFELWTDGGSVDFMLPNRQVSGAVVLVKGYGLNADYETVVLAQGAKLIGAALWEVPPVPTTTVGLRPYGDPVDELEGVDLVSADMALVVTLLVLASSVGLALSLMRTAVGSVLEVLRGLVRRG